MGTTEQSSSDGSRLMTAVGAVLLAVGIGVTVFGAVRVIAPSTGPSPQVLDGSGGPSGGTSASDATEADADPWAAFGPPTSTRTEDDGLSYELVVEGLGQPVAAVLVPGTPEAFYVIERLGIVMLLDGGEVSTVLDISDRITTEGTEQGLVGIALHPEYELNGKVYLSYVSSAGPLRVVEVRRDPEEHAFGSDERLVLEVEQPGIIHHGGTLAFGPDGMLWIGVGDGGSSDDALRHGQNPHTLQGSLLRIDVDKRTAGLKYGIPDGNAFTEGEGRPEIWAYGLRNPWRFAFDEGRVFIADVGRQRWEEINLARIGEPGLNFGWPAKDGPECFRVPDCAELDVTDPIVPIPYDGLCAVIGGPVYRGSEIPAWEGQLLWADYCNGFVVSIAFGSDGPTVTRWGGLGSIHAITSFVVDAAGEIYVLQQNGNLSRVVYDG